MVGYSGGFPGDFSGRGLGLPGFGRLGLGFLRNSWVCRGGAWGFSWGFGEEPMVSWEGPGLPEGFLGAPLVYPGFLRIFLGFGGEVLGFLGFA